MCQNFIFILYCVALIQIQQCPLSKYFILQNIAYINFYYLLFQRSRFQAFYIVMFIFQTCAKSAEIFTSSVQHQALLPGTSDTIIVKHKSGAYKSTPFLACFGPYAVLNQDQYVKLFINDILISDVKFKLDQHGYINPMYLSDQDIKKMGLTFGKNKVRYQLAQSRIQAQIHLFTDNDKILVSDVDGTLTKNDIGGLLNNAMDSNYLHQGYTELVKQIQSNGYKVVWLTMRSLPLYNFSKKYIDKNVGVPGALLTEPEEFLPAIKKQILKQTGNIKANLMNQIRKLFPSKINPFIGGLGNRQNDAIAYHHAGIPLDAIYIIDTKSNVQQMNSNNQGLTYKQMLEDIQNHFPKYKALKIGY